MNICGNFNRLTKRKPKDWIDRGYKIIAPYTFAWREKIGGVQCDCSECEEHYMPYLGVTWFHSKSCALYNYIIRHPQIYNLSQYANRDLRTIASTE